MDITININCQGAFQSSRADFIFALALSYPRTLSINSWLLVKPSYRVSKSVVKGLSELNQSRDLVQISEVTVLPYGFCWSQFDPAEPWYPSSPEGLYFLWLRTSSCYLLGHPFIYSMI
jgi:hypothetical protein